MNFMGWPTPLRTVLLYKVNKTEMKDHDLL